MINESLWEIRATTKMMAELQVQTKALNAITKKLLTQQETIIEYFEYFAHLDSTFDSISAIILWLNQLANAFDVGLDVLAKGRLAPQTFSPSQLSTVLTEINGQLPLGWAISNTELWVTYREAKVSVAALDGRFRLFIEIPIYDHAQQYTLFEIFNLPKVTDNATHGVVFSDLPNFLAVSTDL